MVREMGRKPVGSEAGRKTVSRRETRTGLRVAWKPSEREASVRCTWRWKIIFQLEESNFRKIVRKLEDNK